MHLQDIVERLFGFTAWEVKCLWNPYEKRYHLRFYYNIIKDTIRITEFERALLRINYPCITKVFTVETRLVLFIKGGYKPIRNKRRAEQ